ncbi:flavin reductase family protein [Gordonia sp. w5E2]|uniref:flavin reductase family protein n=1 Tax=Gordonia sp. w5E2 TaxID=3075837 RepID=UPI002F42A15D
MTITDSTHQQSSIDAEHYRTVFRDHPAGVAVITADAGNGPAGLTATSVSSVSAAPAIVMFSLSNESSAAPTIARADTVVVHFMSTQQIEQALTFATSGIDRFADSTSWRRLETGEPVLNSADRWMRGKISGRMVAGTATIVTIEVLEVHVEESEPAAAPLVYHARTWHRLGDHSRLN